MKILFYYPKPDVGEEYMKYPLGVLYLAAVLKREHEILFYDAKVDERSIENVIKSYNPDVLGVSFTTGSKRNAFEIVKKFPDKLFIAGGFHPSSRPKECLNAGFKAVIRREGEIILPKLLKLYENGKEIKGIYDGEIVNNLDFIPFPAREIIPKEYFRKYNQAAIVGSRGCYSGCKFCGSARSGIRQRSPKNIISELEELIRFQPGQPIHFCDDNFTCDAKRVIEITKLIQEKKLNIKYSVNSRVDVKDYSMFKRLKESGCEVISFGIESGSQKILDKAGKGVKIKQIKNTVKAAKDAGLIIRTSWIVGLPGSCPEQLESIALMKEIMPDQVLVWLLTPYPGTVYGDNPDKYGIHLKTDDWTTIFNNIYAQGDFSKILSFDYITSEEIINVVKAMKEEAKELRISIKTFLDKNLLDIF